MATDRNHHRDLLSRRGRWRSMGATVALDATFE
jgi:hypothetical protein